VNNRIVKVDVQVRRFDPVEAELIAVVGCARVTDGTQVKGQLTGPRCPYASTVEIAYRWRELERTHDTIGLRVIVPEPSPWDTEGPFLYEGTLELLEGDKRCDEATIRQGIRTVRFGPRGWRWNGLELNLRTRRCRGLSELEARRLRGDGCNALLLPVDQHATRAWEIADRYGILLFGQINSPAAADAVLELARCTCALGWVATAETLDEARRLADAGFTLGIELNHADEPIPEGCSFVVVPDPSWRTSAPQVWVP
jgi:hypothetical protein